MPAVGLGNEVSWTGGGSDNLFGTPANWLNSTPPSGGANGTDIVHFTGTTSLTPNNNYTNYDQFSQFLFDSTAGSFTLSGNIVKLYSGTKAKIENNSSSLQTVSLNGIQTESAIELDPTAGDLTINSSIYADYNTGQINVYGNAGHTLTLNGTIGQYNTTMSLYVRDNDNVVLTAANGYTGGTTVAAGLLALSGNGTVGTGAVTIGNGAELDVKRTVQLDNTITGGTTGDVTVEAGNTLTLTAVNNYGTTHISQSDLVLRGAGTLGTGTVTFQNSNNGAARLTFGGTVDQSVANRIGTNGQGGVTVDTAGHKITLTGSNNYGYDTTISNGTLVADTTSGSATGTSPIAIAGGGTLAGHGNASGTVSVSGTITAGTGASAGVDSPGTLTTGTQTWNGGGKYAVKFASAAGGSGSSSGYDRLSMDGLNLTKLSAANPFTIQLVNALNGSFDTSTPRTFVIAYAGSVPTLPSSTSLATIASLFTLDTSGVTYANDSRFSLSAESDGNGYDLDVHYTAAPEPAVATLFGFAGASVITRRKRRSQ